MNIVTIEFNSPISSTTIYHNDQVIVESVEGNCSLILETKPVNKLSILNFSDLIIHITNITMFNLGKNKLVYSGLCHDNGKVYQSQDVVPGASWILEYEYPVFTWLHKTLDFGWLIKPDT